jgi:transposase
MILADGPDDKRPSLTSVSQRQAARHAGVSHGSVANWLRAYADSLPATLPTPKTPVKVAEQDELFTFLGRKKTTPTS